MHGNANEPSRLSCLEAKYCFKVEVQNVLREEEIGHFRRKLVWRVAERTIGESNCFDFFAGNRT